MYISGVNSSYDSIIVNGKLVKVDVSVKTTRNMLNILESKGLLVRDRGYKVGSNRQLGSMTLTPEFIKEIKGMVDFSKVKLKEKNSAVILRDDNKELLEFGDSRFIRKIISGVNKYNKLMNNSSVARLDRETGEYVEYHCQAVRIFSRGDFKYNGRFYLTGGSVQTLSSHLREQLLIDGECVAEPDLKGLHLALAGEQAGYYWMEGFDPYSINTSAIKVNYLQVKNHQLEFNSNYNPVRNLLKVCILIMINSKDRAECKYAIQGKLEDDAKLKDTGNRSYQGIGEDIDFEQLFDDITEHHQEIKDVFFSDSGIEFMRLDSDIIGYILDKCVGDNTPCIPVHDSVICKKSDLNKVIQYMKEGYRHVMGSDNNCVIEVK